MPKNSDEQLFHQPNLATLQAGLSCDDPECSGKYVATKRDLTMRRQNGHVMIRGSEYWECEVCGAFVTAKEEVQRIREEVRKQEEYTGRLTLRLAPELHHRLVEEAHANHRSLNNELTYRLQQSLESKSENLPQR